MLPRPGWPQTQKSDFHLRGLQPCAWSPLFFGYLPFRFCPCLHSCLLLLLLFPSTAGRLFPVSLDRTNLVNAPILLGQQPSLSRKAGDLWRIRLSLGNCGGGDSLGTTIFFLNHDICSFHQSHTKAAVFVCTIMIQPWACCFSLSCHQSVSLFVCIYLFVCSCP